VRQKWGTIEEGPPTTMVPSTNKVAPLSIEISFLTFKVVLTDIDNAKGNMNFTNDIKRRKY